MAEDKSGINSVMHTTMQDIETCQCSDCDLRNRETITVGGKVKRIGVIKADCLAFERETTNGKPPQFISNELPCPYYIKEHSDEA